MSIPPSHAVAHRLYGWTLIETMLTLLVLALLCALALPDARGLLDRQRAASARHLLSTDLAFARLAALQYHTDVSVCASVDGRHCADADSWGTGWIVYMAGPRTTTPATPTDILHQQTWHPPSGWRIVSSAGRGRLRYLRDGRAYGTNLSLSICRDDRLLGRVVVNNSGRVRSEVHDTSGGCPR
ncbi:MAG: GspH/FimT family protein [Stenotrophomonas sp.]